MVLLLAGARKSIKDGIVELLSGILGRESFSLDAMELKYLLNSLLMTRRLVILTLSITNDGLIHALVFPLRSFMIFHVFLRSCLLSNILSQLKLFLACLMIGLDFSWRNYLFSLYCEQNKMSRL